MLILIMKNITSSTKYTVQELCSRDPHIFLHSLKVILVISLECKFFHKYFQYILQLIYQLTFFYNFQISSILQHHTIYHIHIHNYWDSK